MLLMLKLMAVRVRVGIGFRCLRLKPIPHPASPLKGEELSLCANAYSPCCKRCVDTFAHGWEGEPLIAPSPAFSSATSKYGNKLTQRCEKFTVGW